MKKGIWSLLFFFLSGFFSFNAQAVSFVGLIGADYQPNHYDSGVTFNSHDVFYAGGGTSPITNIYSELSQLKAAGVTTVRSYQTTEYSWDGIIEAANALSMSVIFEAPIPQTDSTCTPTNNYSTCQAIINANSLIKNVISDVGVSVFNNTVILVLAGHENFDNPDQFDNPSNASYLNAAISNLQKDTSRPVGGAFVAGNLVTPPSLASGYSIADVINRYSAAAPEAFDPYPFQWGLASGNTADQEVTDGSIANSIQYDYNTINSNISAGTIPGGRAIFMAESGWATAGTNPNAVPSGGTGQPACTYACSTGSYPACAPSVANAALYLQALYTFVRTTSNNAGVLAFEAYDEPTKTPVGSMEDYYGVFDKNCNLKDNNTSLLPDTSYVPGSNYGCQGYVNGALMIVTAQFLTPSTSLFTVTISNNTNPTTSQSANMTVKNLQGVTYPYDNGSTLQWPYFLVFPNATFSITSSGQTCTGTVASIDGSQNITFSGLSGCSCSSNTCYLSA